MRATISSRRLGHSYPEAGLSERPWPRRSTPTVKCPSDARDSMIGTQTPQQWLLPWREHEAGPSTAIQLRGNSGGTPSGSGAGDPAPEPETTTDAVFCPLGE